MNIGSSHIRHLMSALSLVALGILARGAGDEALAQNTVEAVPGGVVFQIPHGYMRTEPSNFRGMFMYAPGNPSGMFVIYPNDNETTELLRQRVLNLVAGMFIHDDEGRVVTGITWYEKPIPSHSDDGDGRASAYLNDGFPKQVQVVMYERTTGSRPFLYGYFAMRSKWDKCPDGQFLDDQGQGVKVFDDLWNSFKMSSDRVNPGKH